MGNLVFQATLGGQVNLVGPNTASTFSINVPTVNGNLVTTGDTGTVTNTMLAGSIANNKLTNSSVTIGTTSVSLGATSTTLDGVNIGATTAGTGSFTTLAASGVASFAAGSASAPAITRTGDTNTGMFFPAADTIAFAEGGVEAMRLDSSGNVGIGTTSPSYKLDVNGSIRGDTFVRSTSGTVSSYLVANNGGGFGVVGTASNHPILFNTNDTERMRITSGGDLLVGTTTTRTSRIVIEADGTSTYGMTSNMTAGSGTRYHIVFRESGTERGSVTSNGSATAYNTSSDYRLKENIAPMQNALGVVSQLKPVTYTWKSTGEDGQGFIAHELQAVVPDCVTGEKDAVDADGKPVYQGIDTSFLVATLTAAIQEQQAIIEQLQADVEALKAPK